MGISIGTTAKIAAAATTTGLAAGGLIVAHERVFLKGQPTEIRRSRTLLSAAELAGAGALGTAVGALATHGSTRTAIVASGAALIASSLGAGAWATATASGTPDGESPFSNFLARSVTNTPPLAIRSAEVGLGGMMIGGVVGAISQHSVAGALKFAGVGAIGGAAAGAAAFSVLGANR